jgi:MFS family permease
MHPDLFSNATSPSVSGNGNSNGSSALIPVRHFAGGVILADDPVCKGPDVQGYLAMLRGWQATFESVPGMLTAVPYGVLSDRWGRRGVLGLSLGGISLGVVWTFGVCKSFFSLDLAMIEVVEVSGVFFERVGC